MVAAEDFGALGPWSGAELTRTALENAGVGADSDLSLDLRFLAGVVKLIRRRIAKMGETGDVVQPAIFLLEPVPRSYQPESSPKRVPMLDNGQERLTGRLWFVNAAVSSGHYVPSDSVVDDDELFRIVTDVLSLGDVPAIVFDPRVESSHVRFYSSGLNNLDDCRRLSVAVASISLNQILAVIDKVYSECLVTPDAQPPTAKLWEDSRRWYPIKDAEQTIQVSLKAGLVGAFPTCTTRHEQSSTPGRVDLEIEESDPIDRSVTIRLAILELKVLRSYGSTGEPVSERETFEWVESGLRQAAAYRDDKHAANAALCCFDMRKENTGDTCFDHVRDLAKEKRVELRRWFLFASSELFREFYYGRP